MKIQRLSKIFWPQCYVPSETFVKPALNSSKSQKLMTELGLIKAIGNGLFQITPLAQRVLDKCSDHIEYHMNKIGCQKVSLPILTPNFFWEKTGRLDEGIDEIFSTKDRNNKSFLLSPTHEESAAALVAQSFPISTKHLPIKLYQISAKFRDELKPRFGIMRAREFIMKDLYSFDKDIYNAKKTFNIVNEQYTSFFNSLEVPWLKCAGSPGIMGGPESYEYHILSSVGEDTLLQCMECNFIANLAACPNRICSCGSTTFTTKKGIEVGHTFFLGEKYSRPLGARYKNSNGQIDNLMMGSYGIGLTRLIAASIESLSTDQRLIWPVLLSPFDICIIPPKDGSLDEKFIRSLLNQLIMEITNICGYNSVVLDDRTHLSIGKRLHENKKIGFPIIIIAGSMLLGDDAKFEYYRNNTDSLCLLNLTDILSKILQFSTYKNAIKNLC